MHNRYLINEAAELLTVDGLKFVETYAGYHVIEMAKALIELEDEKLNNSKMPINEFVSRKEDMSRDGRLCLFKQDDGDICISIFPQEGEVASLEFCVPELGGGKSSHTLSALNDLALAMIKDNKENVGRA